MRTVLVLGGTGEARALAAELTGMRPPAPDSLAAELSGVRPPALDSLAAELSEVRPPAPDSIVPRGYDTPAGATPGLILPAGYDSAGRLRVVSSLAGRVSAPRLPVGEVRIGGFGGVAGLVEYLRAESVSAVVDATHPFAERITANAVEACRRAGVPLLVLRRPGWPSEEGWTWVDSLEEAAAAVGERRAFITTGRQGLGAFSKGLARTVDPPEPPVPGVTVLLDRGPYTVDSELELLREHGIEVLVTKDSGGPMTSAKLEAARTLGIPVVVVRRPPLPDGVEVVGTVADAVAWVSRGSGGA